MPFFSPGAPACAGLEHLTALGRGVAAAPPPQSAAPAATAAAGEQTHKRVAMAMAGITMPRRVTGAASWRRTSTARALELPGAPTGARVGTSCQLTPDRSGTGNGTFPAGVRFLWDRCAFYDYSRQPRYPLVRF